MRKTVRTAIVSYLLNMNTALRKNGINGFEKDFLKLMNNGYFGKAIKNLTKHIDIKLLFSVGTKLSCNKNLFI